MTHDDNWPDCSYDGCTFRAVFLVVAVYPDMSEWTGQQPVRRTHPSCQGHLDTRLEEVSRLRMNGMAPNAVFAEFLSVDSPP